MNVSPSILIWVGGALVLLMVVRLLTGSHNRIWFRNFIGNFAHGRDFHGPVNMTYSGSTPPQSEPPSPQGGDPPSSQDGDRIAWVIGIIGLLVAGTGIYLDHFVGR
jgi:hypothetical protein